MRQLYKFVDHEKMTEEIVSVNYSECTKFGEKLKHFQPLRIDKTYA